MLLSTQDKLQKHKKVLIKCDFAYSKKCKGEYWKLYKNVLICRANNDGKDRCVFCLNSLTKTQNNNYNFKYTKKNDFFRQIDSELKAYLLGWVAGDGCLTKDVLKISVHQKDKEILDLFVKTISPQSPIKYREYDHTVNLVINSVEMVRDLCFHLKVNFGKKSDKIVLPDLNDELMWAFIRGLFDSDGSIHDIFSKSTSPRANISSTSVLIKNQLVFYFDKFGIKTVLSKTMVHFGGKNALLFLSKIYDNASFFLNRKRNLYIDWSSWVPFKGILKKPAKKRDKITMNLTGLPWYKKKYGVK